MAAYKPFPIDNLDDERLNVLIAATLSRIDRREAVNMNELISNHPEFAYELRSFFQLSHELGQMMGASAAACDTDQATLRAQRSTTSVDDATLPLLSALPVEAVGDPARIGKYEVRGRLGEGTFGRVFLAFDPLAQRQVAIKMPKPWAKISNDERQAFLHEAQSTATLRHENIVTLLDVHQDMDGTIALVYEFVPGQPMNRVLKESSFTRDEAIRWITEIADALHYAHKRGIVHRDVKPSNILLVEVDGRFQPRVVDFGLALFDNRSWHTGKGHRVGSLLYMSPEQARGDSHWATAQADIFSLGVMLYEALCRRSPWAGSSESAVQRDILHRHPAPPRVFDDSIPEDLERICFKALAKSPENRYTTAGDLARDLRTALQKKPQRRVSWPVLTAAALAVLAMVILGVKILPTTKSSPETPAFAGSLPAPPTIQPQEVRLEVRVQPHARPGKFVVLSNDVDVLETTDGVQLYAQVDKPGYLYCLWFRPNGEVTLLGEDALDGTRPAIQEPSVGPQSSWDTFGKQGVGEHLVVAFTKPTPLTLEESVSLKRARWQTELNRLGQMALVEVGYPRTTSNLADTTRGNIATSLAPKPADDKYLGELGTILKDRLKCYYQGFIFRVHEEGHRSKP